MATVFGSQQPFVDRRARGTDSEYDGPNRRQFSNSYNSARPEVNELAAAIDQYKMHTRTACESDSWSQLYALNQEGEEQAAATCIRTTYASK